MWDGGARFNQGLDTLLRHPIEHPSAYGTRFNRPRSCVAVLGNELSNKGDYVKQYCTQHQLPFVSFRFDKTVSVTKSLEYLSERLETSDRSFLEEKTILLLEGSDVLAFDCDSESAVYQALHLDEWIFRIAGQIQRAKFIVVCLMDRVQSGNGNPAHLKYFYEQFHEAVLYFQPPNSAFVKDFIKQEMEQFHATYEMSLKQYYGNHSYRLELTDENYTYLADASRYASIGHVKRFLDSIWRTVCSASCWFGESINGSVVCAAPFIRTTPMGPHIYMNADALKKEENMMSDTAGTADEIETSTKRMRL